MVLGLRKYFSKEERHERKYQSTIKKGTKFLATEHYFFSQLKGDLAELKKDLGLEKDPHTKKEIFQSKTIADMKKAFRDFRYIGKAETRFERIEEHVEDALKAIKEKVTLSGTGKEVEDLIMRLHTEAADLIRSSSSYEGKIRKYLQDLKILVEKDKEKDAKDLVLEIQETIEQTERWIAALASDLNEAKNIHKASINASDNEHLAQECSEKNEFRQAAQFYLKAGKPRLALKALEKIPETQHDYADYYELMKRAYYELEEFQSAARYHLLGSLRYINQEALAKRWTHLRDTSDSIAHTFQKKRRFRWSLRAPKPAWQKFKTLVYGSSSLLEPKAKAWMLGYANYILGNKETAIKLFKEAGDMTAVESINPK